MNLSDNDHHLAFESLDKPASAPGWQEDISQYDYNAPGKIGDNQPAVLGDDPMLGDIRSEEEQTLLGSGAIDVADHYKNNNKNQNKKSKNPFHRKNNNNNNNNKDPSLINQLQKHDNVAVRIAGDQANVLNNNFKKATASQRSNFNRSPNANMGCSKWCIAMFYWIPIRYLAFLGGWAFLILPMIDIRFHSNISFMQWALYCYIQIFAIVILFIESPTWILTRKIQLKIFHWCRLLRRTWGRACFYITISLMTFAELDQGTYFTLSMLAGVYMMGLSCFMLLFSVLSAKQYRAMYLYMRYDGDVEKAINTGPNDVTHDGPNDIEMEKLVPKLVSYFNELDGDRDGKIGAQDIHIFAENTLARNLSNSERYSIQTFLDTSCNGYVTRADFVKQFATYNQVKFL